MIRFGHRSSELGPQISIALHGGGPSASVAESATCCLNFEEAASHSKRGVATQKRALGHLKLTRRSFHSCPIQLRNIVKNKFFRIIDQPIRNNEKKTDAETLKIMKKNLPNHNKTLRTRHYLRRKKNNLETKNYHLRITSLSVYLPQCTDGRERGVEEWSGSRMKCGR